jgi:hypothetical protein
MLLYVHTCLAADSVKDGCVLQALYMYGIDSLVLCAGRCRCT